MILLKSSFLSLTEREPNSPIVVSSVYASVAKAQVKAFILATDVSVSDLYIASLHV